MPQDANCPKCKHIFPVTEARQAFTVPCPQCESDLTIEFKKPTVPPEAGQPPYDLLVKSGALPGTGGPVTKPKRKADDDDDEPKRKGGSAMIVLLSGGLGLLFVIGGLAVTGWFLFTQIDMTETVSNKSNNNNNKPNNNNNKGNNNSGGNPGGNQGGNPGGNTGGKPPKQEPTFNLRPVSGQLPRITPPGLQDNITPLDLVGKVGSIAVGGGGRYIVMHFPQQGQLGILDVSKAEETVNYVKADTGDVKLAAGLSYAVVWVPSGGGIFRVYSLPDLAKLYEASVPRDNFNSIAMGSRTDGPMLGVAKGDVMLMDVTRNGIKVIEGSTDAPGHHWNMLRASPDGTAFTTFDKLDDNQKVKLLTEVNRKWKITDLPQVPFPGADGNLYGNGIAVSRTKQTMASAGAGVGSGSWLIPAISGNGGDFVKMAVLTSGAKGKRGIGLTVHANRDSETQVPGSPLMTGPEIDALMDIRSNKGHIPWDKPPDQHLFYVPEASLLVILSGAKQKLILRKTNVN